MRISLKLKNVASEDLSGNKISPEEDAKIFETDSSLSQHSYSSMLNYHHKND